MRNLFIFLLLQPTLSFAVERPTHIGHVNIQLVPEVMSIQPGQEFHLAVRIENEKDWHTYWKISGDSGKATILKWKTAKGILAGDIQWPTPERIPTPPLVNYGYKKEAFLIIPFKVSKTLHAGLQTISVHAKWLICKKVCLPGKADLSITLPVKQTKPKPHPFWASEFKKIREDSPKPPPKDWKMSVREEGDEFVLFIQSKKTHFKENKIYQNLVFFPLQDNLIQNTSKPEIEYQDQQIKIRLKKSEYFESTPDLFSVLLTAKQGRGSTQKKISYQLEVPLSQGSNLWQALFFALLGGLLLNLMPCVFPILSIKILSFVQKASETQSHTFKYGIAYSLGTLTSFWILSGVLISLRMGGEELGWGFQLQSPFFISILALLFYLMAMSLLGLFEFGNSIMGLGQKLTTREGLQGSFFTGALAVIVATPCTAPFMGAAIGFGLSQSNQAALFIFTALGVGMSIPYLLLTSVPALAKKLPKPGPWMNTFKQFMAFPLLATVIWLSWVFSFQTRSDGTIYLLSAILLLNFGIWLYQILNSPTLKKIAFALSILLSIWTVSIGATKKTSSSEAARSGEIEWKKFNEEDIQSYRDRGQKVFLNFTAAWCVSCKVNEQIAFQSDEFQRWIKGKNIVFMKGDWTHQDPVISRFLKRLGRSGVPVYAVYDAHSNRAPILLPEFLTTETLINALK